jgi:hypothetical protein
VASIYEDQNLACDTRGGLCTPANEALLPPGDRPIRRTRRSFAPDDHVMPRHRHGLATRTHRVRPSEKTTLRVSPGSSPLGRPSLARPRGGAGSARPQGRRQTSPNVASSRPPAHRKRTGGNAMRRLASSLARRTHGVRPSEKTALRVSPGSSPLGHPSLDSPRGGAGSARPQGRRQTSPNVASSRPPAHRKRTGGNAMPRLASSLAKRTHGVRPSEKTALRVSPGFSPRGHPSLDSPRGGAGSARPQGRRQTSPNVASSRPPAHRKRTGGNAMPRLASSLAKRTHGVRPSEKTALRVSPGFSPRGHPSLDRPPRGATILRSFLPSTPVVSGEYACFRVEPWISNTSTFGLLENPTATRRPSDEMATPQGCVPPGGRSLEQGEICWGELPPQWASSVKS